MCRGFAMQDLGFCDRGWNVATGRSLTRRPSGCLILRCQESPRGPSEAGIHRSSLDNSGCNTAGDLGTVIFDRQRRATRVSFFTALGAGFENWLERNGSEGRF
jgi:hypothetical protein